MKITEIRVSNWIRSKPNGHWREWEVHPSDFEQIFNNKEEDYHGIPISNEWLIKLGFKEDEPHLIIDIDEFGTMQICFDQYRKIISLFSGGFHYYMTEIQFIHQVQNLYSSLTLKTL